ncbi:CIC family chloride channel protein [Rhodoligotrophos appendicifer]|uniref:chloride channel protein n=1 Tax=Rhodoligotrophos appendicifer TaxID=987056 RepID=UPI001180C25B|nr:chloride channel protein [Rhodoligotrophos appendicifer]
MVTENQSLPVQDRLVLVPTALRALVRRSEIWLVLLACIIGALSGVLVAAMTAVAQFLHQVLFGISATEHLSGVDSLPNKWFVVVPAVGGLLLMAVTWAYRRYRSNTPVDPIEANALHGGKMSLIDSFYIALQTMISNGFGASVGMEAGYTQVGSGTGSAIGEAFRLRRSDLRLLVGCGAAGAIGAAFAAPLAGAFYAFELILGTYTIAALAPIGLAAITGVVVNSLLVEPAHTISVTSPIGLGQSAVTTLLLLGLITAGVGIAIMRGVTAVEDLFKLSKIPVWLRPAVGGLAIGMLALITPRILSSGHGALSLVLDDSMPTLRALLILLVLKAAASAISLGSGFRGGLFFASLFLGAIVGKAYVAIVALIDPALAPDPQIAAIVGMTGLAVAIIGAPLTMAFLALETTNDLPLTIAVLCTAVVTSVAVRKTFGYSFATWRFHLRGEAIRSAHDVGWMFDLTVRRLMRHDVRTIHDAISIRQFRQEFSLGSTQRVIVVDDQERYVGIVLVADVHSPTLQDDKKTIQELLRYKDLALLPWMNIKEAAQKFDESESEALAVIDGNATRKVVGLLTEAHTLRRYTEELEKARKDLAGDR